MNDDSCLTPAFVQKVSAISQKSMRYSIGIPRGFDKSAMFAETSPSSPNSLKVRSTLASKTWTKKNGRQRKKNQKINWWDELNILIGLAGNRTPDHSHAKGAEEQMLDAGCCWSVMMLLTIIPYWLLELFGLYDWMLLTLNWLILEVYWSGECGCELTHKPGECWITIPYLSTLHYFGSEWVKARAALVVSLGIFSVKGGVKRGFIARGLN